jgi:hypothetical protein
MDFLGDPTSEYFSASFWKLLPDGAKLEIVNFAFSRNIYLKDNVEPGLVGARTHSN